MLTLPPSVKIYLATEPVHMHRSYDGLSGAAREVFEQDPMSGHLFVFINRTRTQLKALYWDRGGYCVLGKRLERGRFKLPSVQPGQRTLELEAIDLTLLLEGIELQAVTRRPRWKPQAPVRLNVPAAEP